MCGRWSRTRSPSPSRAAAIRWSSRRSAPRASPSSPTTARSAPRARRGRAHLAGHRPEHGRQVDLPPPERADRDPRPDRRLRAGEVGAYRRRRPPVQPRRRRRRSRPRPLDLHGRDGRDRGDPQPGRPARAGHPRRDRPRHGDLRRPLDRLGGDRASARGEPQPRPLRHALSRADGARRRACRGSATSR